MPIDIPNTGINTEKGIISTEAFSKNNYGLNNISGNEYYLSSASTQSSNYLNPEEANLQPLNSSSNLNNFALSNSQADLVWRNYATGQNTVWQMNGTTLTNSALIAPVSDTNWKIQATGDFNNDGQTDLVWRNNSTGQNVVWLMNGNTLSNSVLLNAVSDTNWQIQVATDFNNDSQTDLVWRNDATGQNVIWLMNGTTLNNSVLLNAVSDTNWKIQGAGDFNNDGQTDLVWRNYATGQNIVWQMNGTTLTNSASIAPVSDTNWKIQGTGDFNNDAKTDLVWRNNSTGQNVIWLMNGTTLSNSVLLNAVSDTNWQIAGTLKRNISTIDLKGTYFTSAKPLNAGNNFNINFSIQNSGNTSAGAFKASFYLSTDSTITTSDYYLGVSDISSLSANGSTGVLTKNLNLPVAGDYFWSGNKTYYIGMIVDSGNAIAETNESNNANTGNGLDYNDVSITIPINDPIAATGTSSGNNSIESLVNQNRRYWNTSSNGGIITYSFYKNTSGAYYGSETVSEVSEAVKTNTRQILQSLERTINVRFIEVADTANSYGVIRYMFSNGGSSNYNYYAYAYYPSSSSIGGDVHLNPNYETDSVNKFSGSAGNYGYMALGHETLHALGLKHPGNYDAGGGGTEGPYLSPVEDNTTNTVMTYNISAGAYAITPMSYDIRALQYLYGMRSYNSTDTNYSFRNVYDYTVGGQEFGSLSTTIKQTLWDSGGTADTLDFSGLSSATNYRFDMREGGILTTQSAYNGSTYTATQDGSNYQTTSYGTAIAYGTLIENLVNSRGSDYIIANIAANTFKGYTLGTSTGNDIFESTSSSDVLELSGYTFSNLAATISGSNLTITLGSYGSIQINNYYSANGSMKFLIGGNYYTYSSSGNWQVASPPATTVDADLTPYSKGLTATTLSGEREILPDLPPIPNIPVISKGMTGTPLDEYQILTDLAPVATSKF